MEDRGCTWNYFSKCKYKHPHIHCLQTWLVSQIEMSSICQLIGRCRSTDTLLFGKSSVSANSNSSVCGAPWTVASRLHGQRTRPFLWHPVLSLFQEDRPIPTRPCPEMRILLAVLIGVISISPRAREVFWHLLTCEQPHFPRMHTISIPHPFRHQTNHHSHDKLHPCTNCD